MYLNACVCFYTYVIVYTHMCTNVRKRAYVYMHVREYIYVCIYVFVWNEASIAYNF